MTIEEIVTKGILDELINTFNFNHPIQFKITDIEDEPKPNLPPLTTYRLIKLVNEVEVECWSTRIYPEYKNKVYSALLHHIFDSGLDNIIKTSEVMEKLNHE